MKQVEKLLVCNELKFKMYLRKWNDGNLEEISYETFLSNARTKLEIEEINKEELKGLKPNLVIFDEGSNYVE